MKAKSFADNMILLADFVNIVASLKKRRWNSCKKTVRNRIG